VTARLKVRRAVSREDLQRAYSIRLRVFVREQGVPREIELDRDDQLAIHLVAEFGGKIVGTTRLVIKHGKAKIGRMAVLKHFRGRGVGKELLRKALVLAKRSSGAVIFLHAQVPVISFYEKMGFHCVGRVFLEANIPHHKMVFRKAESRRGRDFGSRKYPKVEKLHPDRRAT
jgi:predicted GNAT family N-acyltransferase